MTLAIPDPLALADRAASVFEAQFPGCDARSPNRALTVIGRVSAMSSFDEFVFLAGIGQEVMPDTAVAWLPRHGSIRGIPQLQPAASLGNAFVLTASTNGSSLTIPAGFAFISPGGIIGLVVTPVSIPPGTEAVVQLQASEPGSDSNVAPGTVMKAVSPLAGLSPQSALLDTGGMSGGTDLQSIAGWRAAILARWRAPAMGGAAPDYPGWAKAANSNVQYVYVAPALIGGLGNVGVTILMAGPRVPTTSEVAEVNAALQAARPVTARVGTYAGSLLPVNVSLTLNPDTTATRAAAQAALALFFAQDAQIGGQVVNLATGYPMAGYTLYMSRLDNALSSSDGEYSHERLAPAADLVPGTGQLPVLGTLTFVAA